VFTFLRNAEPLAIRGRLPVVTLVFGLVLTGCNSGPYQSAPVDANQARVTLKTALESWKSGESTEALRAKTPSIVVQDFDWSGGTKLFDYEVLDAGQEVDANLIAKVKLTIADKKGSRLEKTVYYVVGTAPVFTVFRDSFR
jgi:hypothetical protein